MSWLDDMAEVQRLRGEAMLDICRWFKLIPARIGARLEARARARTMRLLGRMAAWLETRCTVPGCNQPRNRMGSQYERHGHAEPATSSLDEMTADGHTFDWQMNCACCGRSAQQIALDRRPTRQPPPTPMPGPGRRMRQ